MRIMLLGLACIAGLSACADGKGQVLDPRYRFGGDQPYNKYRASRELALTGAGAVPTVVPEVHPFKSPDPEDIASPTAYQILQGSFGGGTAKAAASQGNSGYYDPATGKKLTSGPASAPEATQTNPDSDILGRYAKSHQYAPGTLVYPRIAGGKGQASNACNRYKNADTAQLAFMSAGGPEKDTMVIDPDGDGFVCGWEPGVYLAQQR